MRPYLGQLLKIVLVCFYCFLWFESTYCDVSPGASGVFSWNCLCSPGDMTHDLASNCSTFCNCIYDGSGINKNGWSCSCTSDENPVSSGTIYNAACFTTCNCTSEAAASSPRKSMSKKWIVAIIVLCVVTILIISSIVCYFCGKHKNSIQPALGPSRKDTSSNSGATMLSSQSGSFLEFPVKVNSLLSPIIVFARKLHFMLGSEKGDFPGTIARYFYSELEAATDKFSSANLIGIGGSSSVYRGQLKDGKVVAVKRLKPLGGTVVDSEFLTEIELLSRLHHRHVVPLLGFCLESRGKQSERLLVFEFMANGSLRECLDAGGKRPMNWETRVAIAMGAARGIEYMHEAAAPRILHRDIKSTNILLDEKYTPKITDLGMAKLLMVDDDEHSSSCAVSPARMQGTFGYFAPEYSDVGNATTKSDVFSFGVVVLELITGRPPILRSANNGDESLALWAIARLRDSKLVISELPDPLLEGKFPQEEMQIMGHLARECLQWDPDSRPTMGEVVQILSVIAPDMSTGRNLRASFLAASSFCAKSSSSTAIPESDGQRWQESSSGAVEMFPATTGHSHEREGSGDTVLSAKDMERLIFLGSNRRSWHFPLADDETVHLTEPRFESFLQANTR